MPGHSASRLFLVSIQHRKPCQHLSDPWWIRCLQHHHKGPFQPTKSPSNRRHPLLKASHDPKSTQYHDCCQSKHHSLHWRARAKREFYGFLFSLQSMKLHPCTHRVGLALIPNLRWSQNLSCQEYGRLSRCNGHLCELCEPPKSNPTVPSTLQSENSLNFLIDCPKRQSRLAYHLEWHL